MILGKLDCSHHLFEMTLEEPFWSPGQTKNILTLYEERESEIMEDLPTVSLLWNSLQDL
jgi:hypothetical protein